MRPRVLVGSGLAGMFALLAALGASARERPRLKLVPRLWGTGEVHVVDAAGSHLLERFTEPHHVVGSEVSPDGRFAYVWGNAARPPLRVVVYGLESRTRIADFAPGFGGDLQFTPADNLFHDWGCGTNCHGFALYDRSGITLLKGVTAGADVSPHRRYLVTSSSLMPPSEPIVVYDLDEAKKLYDSTATLGDAFVGDAVRWDEAKGRLEIRFEGSREPKGRLLIRIESGKAIASVRR